MATGYVYISCVTSGCMFLSVLAYSLRISFNAHINTVSNINLYQLSLLACARRCGCLTGYTHINYSKRLLHCECIPGTQIHRGLHVKQRVGYISAEVAGVLGDEQENCTTTVPAVCPPLSIDNNTMVVLGNMYRVGNKLMLQCPSCHEMDGLNMTTCGSGGVWSEHGACVAVTSTTIRSPCQTNKECCDEDSECRDGQCWCKPGLSHDPGSLSCVAFCPDGYGNTFQILKDYIVTLSNIYDQFVDDLEACMTLCLEHFIPGYVCIYADYYPHCYLNKVPPHQKPQIDYYGYSYLLQRDCKAST